MKSDNFRTIAIVLLVATIAFTVVNDIGAILTTYYNIDDETKRIANEALRSYKLYSGSHDQALLAAKSKAEQDGAVLTGFQITQTAIRVAVRLPAKRTWVAHRVSWLQPYLQAEGQLDLPLR
ncbi:hypothetical protein LCGC14_2723800 [marine sediment metagenome]|uniref:Uncharacterized protein n=1 Tax=marine sediment metagenome TaxID=412755 RepID=A0A0F8Z9H1_9ZZZZ